jgi:hypothetical protein
MLETEQSEGVGHKPAWLVRMGRSISAKLMASIFVVMLLMFAALGYFSIRLHQKHLEAYRAGADHEFRRRHQLFDCDLGGGWHG